MEARFQEQLLQLYSEFETVQKTVLTPKEREDIANIYVDPKFKAWQKLIDNVMIDLQNKVFREAGNVEDFKAVKWAIMANNLIKTLIKQYYISVTNKQDGERPKADADFEGVEEIHS